VCCKPMRVSYLVVDGELDELEVEPSD